MDFFQHQDAARRKTAWLVFLFVAAVVAIVLAIYAVFTAALGKPWDPSLFAAVTLGTVLVIAAGSLYKIAELSRGGESVALMLGGRRIDPQTSDLAERRLLNVVEEMALASGIPVPPVYVLDHEPAINAFAAGHGPRNAVVAVSHGCLTYLTRDELQGVMGHEFSHILNGDMRLNIRLIGILNGILLLAIIGYYILRSGPRSSGSKKGGGGWILLVGLGLLVIGYIGLFFAKLIRSSVSRQREYLADASAVQFTRYPQGIAGALKKIGGLDQGSTIKDAHADEVSHMFFGDAFAVRFLGLFATHPPLSERVRRIDPTFDGEFPPSRPLVEEAIRQEAESPLERRLGGREIPPAERPSPARPLPVSPAGVVNQVGVLAAAQLAHAAALIEATPKVLAAAAAEPYSARAVVYAILLSREEDVRNAQLASLQDRAEDLSYRETLKLAPLVDALSDEARLPLVDRTFPALKGLSPKQYDEFRANVEALIHADGKIDLLEYTIQSMLVRTLDVHFGRAKPVRIQYYAMAGVIEPAATVLSTLAYSGSTDDAEVRRAFDLGTSAIGRPAALRPKEQCTLKTFAAALEELAKTAPKVKRQIVAACASCVAADGTVTVREGELLRAITSALGCPLPPIVAAGASE